VSIRTANCEPNPLAGRVPNVVLILADDLGYADVGCYGATDIRTPHLDALAKGGVRFTNFCVAQAVCTASRAALLSGCYPNRIGLAGALNHTSTNGIHPDELLLPEIFQASGYATACFGKWHLGTKPEFFPTRNGFDRWAGLPYSNDNGPLHPTVKGIPPLPFYENDKVVASDPEQSQFTSQLTDYAVKFIADNKDRPFFLYLPHVMPHVPIFASAKFKGKSSRGLYGDVVEELDDGVGRLLAKLKELELEQHTLVIFLSDNGPFLSYGNHAGRAQPFREGKLTTFEGGLRVPFIVSWPAQLKPGKVNEEFITGLDLLPSLAAVIGAKLPAERKIDGVDLSPLFLGYSGAMGRQKFACYSGSELHAVRNGDWKQHLPHDYITVDGPPGNDGKPANFANMKPNPIEQSGIRGIASRHGYRVERLELSLFNLRTDPGEKNNVALENPRLVAELLELAANFRSDLGDSLMQAKGSGLRAAGVAK
jgi:arylsulfatase A-like enzyme